MTVGIGHNEPPPFERITLRAEEIISGAARAAVEFPLIDSQSLADRYSGFLKQLRAVIKEAAEAEKDAKAPHQQAVKEIAATWAPIKTRLETAQAMLEPKLGDWLAREKHRIAAEQEALRRAAEAAQAAARRAEAEAQRLAAEAASGALKGSGADPVEAQAKAAEMAQAAKSAESEARAAEKAKPQAGASYAGPSGRARASHSVKTYSAKILSWEKAAVHYSTHPKVREAIQIAANASVRSLKEGAAVPGVVEVEENEGWRI